ncbi:2-hydroxyacid dehydrogenase [Halalkalicoccus jeotgali]|nr:2-hydroxyacid dehydrogenase [Halalkalicoccus jeotgali]ADJ16530.1 D-isomer specific 2-hydroxyacid dehydrogenase NAD-binding protein [Halalkalicoccus jeotgali B3]
MYEALEALESRGVSFERMDWMDDSSPTEFRNVTMDMESLGPGSYDTDTIAANLDGVDALVVHKAPVSRELITGADLSLVAAARGGTENIDVEAAVDNGVTVLRAPGRNRDAVADYAVSMLLSRLREIPFNHAELSDGEWNQVFDPDQLPPDVRTMTVGIVGFGHIGRGVARRLAGFDPELLVYDPFVDDEDIRDVGPEPADLDTLLADSDAVTLHVRLSEDTKNMIGHEEFERMNDNGYLVNTARGGLIDTDALVAAVSEGAIAGAALDVFDEEPIPAGHPLFDLDGVVLTPHVAGSTRDAVLGGPRIIASQLETYLDGETPAHVVD